MIAEEFWISRTLQLAALGLGKVQPNPLVGAVIVYNEHIIGEGFHQHYGSPHAEVNAVNAVENQELLKESTLYVNLEPCAHFGKTPPCTSLIIEKHIPKVVIGMQDPNEKVRGKGIKILRDAGIEVVENVLYKECLNLNRRFNTFHTKKRPYIILKWAQTKNGFMDILKCDRRDVACNTTSKKYWITNEALRVWAHKLRNEEQAILVGYNTLKNDNPQLTNRLYGSNQPRRFVWCDERKHENINNSFSYLYGNIEEVLFQLYEQNTQSLIVEGGKKTLQKFIDAELWDEVFLLVGNVKWEEGVYAPKILYNYDNKIDIEGEAIYHFIKTK
ncbi:MAG: bifunctional diaminohydroxyphosphoribosylaminopyrimidine deaminase/5-amino-6-(5-phosphoribosylamino)uracil reductase RibD [Bacteroidales bacterium]|jgi:diaminohydroxyphosphoribosylaminopyrimidine deaminase/5-amino-6-(5-phosphoribosylamino)uracil reductase|nr:bifunctional diaminohydroxyphosphoribosylaminopyrimidine deaminase/5-amino-6-(5-phosphoribosylamino)uracil reductase RibD [Bacteroidales bacterium]